MGLLSLIPALINHALLFTVVGNWSITTAEPPPTSTRHTVYSPTATTITAVTSLPIHSGPRLQCYFKSYFWPMQGSWGWEWGWGGVGGVATHPLQLLFISVATGHQHSFQSSPYSAMRFLPGLPVQAHVTTSPKSWPKSYHCMYTTGIVIILFVCFPNNCNNDSDKGWKEMEYKKMWEIIEAT